MDNKLPANRVAALASFLVAVATALTTAAGAWGNETVVKAVGIGVGIVGAVLTVIMYLNGSQKWEAYQADPFKNVNPDGSAGNLYHPKDDPFAPPYPDDEADQGKAFDFPDRPADEPPEDPAP